MLEISEIGDSVELYTWKASIFLENSKTSYKLLTPLLRSALFYALGLAGGLFYLKTYAFARKNSGIQAKI